MVIPMRSDKYTFLFFFSPVVNSHNKGRFLCVFIYIARSLCQDLLSEWGGKVSIFAQMIYCTWTYF